MQPSKSRSGKDATRGYSANSAVRCSLLESEMRAVVVLVANIISEQTPQVAPVQSDHVIQQVTPAALNPTLRNSILPRTPQRSADALDFHRSDRSGDLRPILGVTIEDDEPWSRPKWKRLPQLLDGPQARRMAGNVDVQDAPPVVADDEEAVEHAEPDRRDGKEIHGRNRFPVVSKEREPTFGWLRLSRRPLHPTRNGSLRDIEAEHKKFAMDARRSPRWVLNNHPENQLSNFLRGLSSPNLYPDSGDQSPIHTKTGPVPTDHSFRRDNDESFFPS